MGNIKTKETKATKSEPTETTESSSNSNKVRSTSLSIIAPSLSATSNRLRLVTWNIYGLGNKDTLARTSAACDILESLFPDVIFLQEVIPKTLHFIQERLGSLYQLVPGGEHNAYFTLTLVKRSPGINMLQTKIHPFPNTKLGRNLLIVKTACYGVKVTFMNTHLESRMQDRPERRNQLSQCMAEMKAQGPEMVAIFGGDTNLDDQDDQESDIPAGIVDVWEACGKENQTRITFDTTIDPNVPGKIGEGKKLRLDRIFIRPALVDQDDAIRNLKAATFELIGKERIPECNNSFPSDHWGVVCEFGIV